MTSGLFSAEWRERSGPPENAVAVAARECERLGLTMTVRRAGSPSSMVVISELAGPGGIRAVGTGKGVDWQARASSDFEALERFFTVTRLNSRFTGRLELFSMSDLAAQSPLAVDCVVTRWARDLPDRRAAASAYSAESAESVEGGDSAVWYPLLLNDPAYYTHPVPGDDAAACRKFLRYTSSIGTAAGVNSIDSRLHGLCELIEHDSLSHALLRWFVVREKHVAIVNPADLPPDLRRLHDAASAELGKPVVLVDITTELGIPSYLAIGDTIGELSVRGSGASPSGWLAASRALHELIQSIHVAGDSDAVRRRRLRTLSRWPALRTCYQLSASGLLEGDVRQVPIRADPPGIDTPRLRLRWVDARLAAHGISSFSRELAPTDSLISVVATVAPALDRFSLVLHGVPVLPTGRALRLWGRPG